jgi:hypothetical protein
MIALCQLLILNNENIFSIPRISKSRIVIGARVILVILRIWYREHILTMENQYHESRTNP